MRRKKIVAFTGAGVSADSGISTFRDEDGLWARYRIEDVCTPEALARNRAKVIEFYNIRHDVQIVTQNIDDLHERAGSTKVIHLHGELRKLRSSSDESLVVPIDGWEQKLHDTAPDGSLLRPFVVFFGESVPMFERAAETVSTADLFIIAGTSLAVHPAASLARYTRAEVPVYLVDPGDPDTAWIRNPIEHIKESSATGMPLLVERLIRSAIP